MSIRFRLLLLACIALLTLSGCSALRKVNASEATETQRTTGVDQTQETDKEPLTKSKPAIASVTMLPQVSPAIEAGQYSGITWLGENHYAVVHDKLAGGGIVLFDIDIHPETGVIERTTATVTDATRLAAVTGMDNEGIAFSNGRLYVSAEYDQSIREYELDGTPTGRHFRIPEEMQRDRIAGNAGFEALTFNAKTGLFWTTTEQPLPADQDPPRLHRLQSFGTDLQPARQYLYQMDEPLRRAEGTRAYVHGISALAALDDGRLIVLEREIYVPSSILKALSDTFSLIKLYVVDPTGDKDGILPKKQLAAFSTTLGSLANYEGMCLGPTLTDGRHTLILIADSQGGMSGLTQEYLKVILF